MERSSNRESSPNHQVTKKQETTSMEPSVSLLDLPDEVLVHIGLWVGCFGVRELAIFQSCSRKVWQLLSTEQVLQTLVKWRKIKIHPHIPLTTLPQIWLYELVSKHTNLLQENRIGFEFASLEIYNDSEVREDEWQEGDIRGSLDRMRQIQHFLWNHIPASYYKYTPERNIPTFTLPGTHNTAARHNSRVMGNVVKVVLDAHCGLPAPDAMAPGFSLDRGIVVEEELNLPERRLFLDPSVVKVHPWGKLAVQRYLSTGHDYQPLARRGKGWVEVRLQLLVEGDDEDDASENSFLLPPRPPEIYDDIHPYEWQRG